MIADQVKTILETADLSTTTCTTMAVTLGMSATGLRRRLASENTTYWQLLCNERIERIRGLFDRNPHAGNYQIAKVCGYATPNTASLAFKRLTGVTLYQHKFEGAGI